MRIKSYFDSSIPTAMRQARGEFGDDVMLVTSRITAPESRHLGDYEVVFAVDSAADQNEGGQKAEAAPSPAPPPAPSFGKIFREQFAPLTSGVGEKAGVVETIHASLVDIGFGDIQADAFIALIRSCAPPVSVPAVKESVTAVSLAPEPVTDDVAVLMPDFVAEATPAEAVTAEVPCAEALMPEALTTDAIPAEEPAAEVVPAEAVTPADAGMLPEAVQEEVITEAPIAGAPEPAPDAGVSFEAEQFERTEEPAPPVCRDMTSVRRPSGGRATARASQAVPRSAVPKPGLMMMLIAFGLYGLSRRS